MFKKINKFSKSYTFVIVVLVFIAIVSGVIDYLSESFMVNGSLCTHYNNYLIFKNSSINLFKEQDLYAFYTNIHFDLFKYSSTFSLLFSFFTIFPDSVGLVLWNIFNVFVYFCGVYSLPRINKNQKILILLIPFFELFTTVQNEQSNTLVIGLFFLTFSFLEQKKIFLATLFIILSIYLKLYGFVGFSLFLLYPNKIKAIGYSIFWFVFLFFLPLVAISYDQLIFNYNSWLELLIREHPQIYGISFMGWLNSNFGFEFNSMYAVLFGVIVYLLSLFRYTQWKFFRYRLLLLCSLSIWVVIFNHRAESASYIIAFLASTLWFVTEKKTTTNIVLFSLAFLLTSMSASDLFPAYLRINYVYPYKLKALPMILIWFKIILEMMFYNFQESTNESQLSGTTQQ